jgi:hypothetical protein
MIVQRQPNTQRRAAGVSPPWFGNGTGKADAANVRGTALCANVEHTQRTVGGHCNRRDVRRMALCANVEQGGLVEATVCVQNNG